MSLTEYCCGITGHPEGLRDQPGFVFQGKASEDRKTSVEVETSWGESKVGKQVGCLQAVGKEAQVQHSAGQSVVETAEGTAKAESLQQS